MQRKDEILAKKAKLAELRRQREEREQRHREGRRESVLEKAPRQSVDRQELDSFIDTLVGDGTRSQSPATVPSESRTRPTSGLGNVQVGSETYQQASPTSYVTNATQTLDAPVTKEIETYSKSVQTTLEWVDPQDKAASQLQQREEHLRQNLRREIEAELKAVDVSLPSEELQSPKYPIRGLSNEELNAVTSSEDFLDFVERSSKVIEKALDNETDILATYALQETPDDGSDDDKESRRLRQTAQFWDSRSCSKRMISDVRFSPKYPELLLASYTKNPSSPQDPRGLVHVWNLNMQSRPEYTFHSTSDILTAQFSPFHPSLIVGGSYGGQVVLWDTRSRSPMPVQKTPLAGTSGASHAHPVYSICIVGTQNANNIISCSTDGVVCGWTPEMLTNPQEYLELTTPPPSRTDDLSPTCMAFSQPDPTSFLVGTEEGSIFACHRYDRAGAKAGVDTRFRYRGHTAPVMSLDFHSSRGAVDLSELVLSTGLDWSIKLWRVKAHSAVEVAPTARAVSGTFGSSVPALSPILELAHEDVVYDARWSPVRPGVFASVDGSGNVDVWDLTADVEVPVARDHVQTDASVHGSFVPKSLNKVAWDGREGRRMAVGGAAGIVTIFDVSSGLSGETAKSEEWTKMKRLVSRSNHEQG